MKILIVGASFAGVACAKTLIEQHSGHEVIIVEPRNYVEINYMTPRLLQEPEKHSETVAKLETLSWAPHATVVQATVTRLESKEAGLSNGGTVTFDICVICCGAVRY
jgi:NADH dehydrogenase FAD-containing subunit